MGKTDDAANSEPQLPYGVQPGWQGRYYEDFTVGDVYRSSVGRTITETDNVWFTHLTLNTNQLHFNRHFAERSRWGKTLVNSTFTLALVTGMSVADVSQNAMANLGWDEVKLPAPVFVGDTLYAESQVLAKRESKSYPEAGIVKVRTQGVNQSGEVVIDFVRHIMVYKRGHSPQSTPFPERTSR